MATRGQHDLGGLPAGPIDIADHAALPWEKLVMALFQSLRSRGHLTVDELRRALEDLPPEQYAQPYFERWSEAIANILEEKGLATRAEISARIDDLRAKLEAAE